MKTPLCTGFDNTAAMSRRQILSSFGAGLGAIALGDITNPANAQSASGKQPRVLHHTPKAKRIIFLCQSDYYFATN